jgi:WD40 repeat protein
MHVVDVDSGKVRYSLTLPGRDSLKVAAGSPDGRLLALGTAAGDVAAVLWNLDSGRSLSLRADDAHCDELNQLQWSPDGQRLWGRCVNALVQWELPANWQSRRE